MTRRRKHSLIFAPSPSERASEARERELRELEKMMTGNTYEKRGGKVKQRRHSTD